MFCTRFFSLSLFASSLVCSTIVSWIRFFSRFLFFFFYFYASNANACFLSFSLDALLHSFQLCVCFFSVVACSTMCTRLVHIEYFEHQAEEIECQKRKERERERLCCDKCLNCENWKLLINRGKKREKSF